MINEEILARCRPGVKIVNCARGGIIDEAALLDSLNSKHCGGAGLDVYAEVRVSIASADQRVCAHRLTSAVALVLKEPPTSLDLAKHPNVVATPHLGASTKEAQSRVAEEIAQQFIDSRDGKSLFGAVSISQPTVLSVPVGSCLLVVCQWSPYFPCRSMPTRWCRR
mgnify:CR=1 FL=1